MAGCFPPIQSERRGELGLLPSHYGNFFRAGRRRSPMGAVRGIHAGGDSRRAARDYAGADYALHYGVSEDLAGARSTTSPRSATRRPHKSPA